MQNNLYIEGLIKFNQRVLTQGTIDEDYTNDALYSKMFFNGVYWFNMNEIFQKYVMNNFKESIVPNMKLYIDNINAVIKQFNIINDDVKITNDECFEKRLISEMRLEDQINSVIFKNILKVNIQFKPEILYYFTFLHNGAVVVSWIDMTSEVYGKPFKYEFEEDGITYYWKTDNCIIDYLNEIYNSDETVEVIFTKFKNKNNIVTKIEYNGSKNAFNRLLLLFKGQPALVALYNPYLFFEDIQDIIKENRENKNIREVPDIKDDINLDYLMKEDCLLEYPNDSFDGFLDFLIEAVENKDVSEIYITLYRIGNDPKLFNILQEGVLNGKSVNVNIELCASGEKINKFWMKEMQECGINVTTYKCGELKVHAKLTLVKFKSGIKIAQIGTGNFHTKTTAQYTDLSLFTINPKITNQVELLFKIFEHPEINFNNSLFDSNFLVTQYNMRYNLYRLIDNEGMKGNHGLIFIKCNALEDEEIINHLSRAAENGCNIHLIIRGACTWVPKELNKNVFIKSIVWDKLEHSRVYCFGSNPNIYIGSLDLVTSKLDNRIETLVKVINVKQLVAISKYINKYLNNKDGSWLMRSDGEYIKEEVNK